MRSPLPDFHDRALRHRTVPHRLVGVLGMCVCIAPVCAADAALADPAGAEAPMQLRSTDALQERYPGTARQLAPTFIYADQMQGRPDQDISVRGHVELRRGDLVIKADTLEHDQTTDLARAQGQVHINRSGNVFEGPQLELKLDTSAGFFLEPRYQFLGNDIHGQAQRADFLDDQRAVLHDASFTSCKREPGPNWLPAWILQAATLRMDQESDEGVAQQAVLRFKGLPLLPIPYLSFPLSDKRKSGLLPPTPGLDNVNGLEYVQPYYWNIAPNRDATFTPTIMTKRGVNLGTEFRYLEPGYSGQVRLDVMPGDQLRQRNRWGTTYAHQGTLNNAWTRWISDAGLALSLNLNRVSDDDYWRDFARASGNLTQRLLPNEGLLTWSSGAFSSQVRALKWQTLQDETAPITPPYDRLPQWALRYARTTTWGLNYTLDLDYTHFVAESELTAQPNAQRTVAQLQLSRPWVAPQGFLTPRLQLHARNYGFDAPLADGSLTASSVVPTFSLDSGLVFERDTQYFGRSVRQTLEPRAFYVNTPYRDQHLLPNYDSAAYDFNFATIYTENAFVGHDRLSDSNLLTLGVTSRLLDPLNAAQLARFSVAQRLRLKDQNVVLPGGQTVAERLSDVLLGASLNWDPGWAAEATWQFNPKTEQSERVLLGARYSPSPYRTLSAAYRYQRTASEQMDLGWQWPINDLWADRGQDLGAGLGQGVGRWYSVGRLNYSLNEGKLVDALLGFEYDAGCWLGRLVLERLQTSTSSATQRVMFQLELVGLTRLGASPLRSLKDNIPGYQYLREAQGTPSRFSHYE